MSRAGLGWISGYVGALGVGLTIGLDEQVALAGAPLLVGVALVGMVWGRPEWAFWWFTLGGAALVGASVLVQLGSPPVEGAGMYLDDLGRSLVALTALVFPVVALMSLRTILVDRLIYFGGMVLIEYGLWVCFTSSNLLVFYIAFEALAFPMFVQIGRFGSNDKARRRAAFKFFVYTLLGSATALPGVMLAYRLVGSLEWTALTAHPFTQEEEVVLAGCFTVPFFVKIPIAPLHLWLVEAHVEAPAPSSMVLAGLLLKTGGYGYLRWVSGVYPGGAAWWGWLTLTAAVVGATLASVFALVQTDLKRMLAYSSVAHMGVATAGLVVNTPLANQGAVYTMLAHGFASTGLFAGVGALYDRYHTRDVRDFGGVAQGAPWLGGLFFVLALANFGFPFTGNFVGEFATLGEVVRINLVAGLTLGGATFLGLVYTMWGYNRVFLGRTNPRAARIEDLYPAEWAALVVCVGGVVVLGFTGGAYCEATLPGYTPGAPRGGPW